MTAQAGGAALRREQRKARKALDPVARQQADALMLAHIRNSPVYRAARRVAMFFAFDGEPDLSPLLQFSAHREYFAPVITGPDMHFARIDKDTRLARNKFGILQPATLTLIDPRSLDLVLTPLVAFDRNGNRIGVGGGYYDRCFAFLRMRRYWHKPKLLGTAYALQEIDPIDPNPWDVALWGAVTENELIRFA